MKAVHRNHLAFLGGALLVVALGGLLMKVRYEFERARETGEVRELLAALSDDVSRQLQRGAVRVYDASGGEPGSAGWHGWRFGMDAGVYLGGGEPDIAPASLRRALSAMPAAARMLRIVGPFATRNSDTAIALAVPVEQGAAGKDPVGVAGIWSGASITLHDLMSTVRVADAMKRGYRLQLADAASGTALYQSDAGALDAAVLGTFGFGGSLLQWRAAPREGWRAPPGFLSSSLFVLLAILVWLGHELRRGRLLRNAAADLRESEARRRDTNALYGKAIESVAALESRLQVVSTYDTVTGLANRGSLVRRIDATLETMRQNPNGILCVLSIGFDQVHHITNSFGTEFSSRVLVVAAERVEFVLPSRDLLFRIGDFQLAVVLPQAGPDGGRHLAERIIREIEAPISLDSHTFMLHPSVGIAETVSGYEYAETLLDRASTALGAVPRDAQVRYCLFDSSTAKESVSRLQLEVDLNRAFDENQFVLEYEPIVMPVTLAVAGFEALIRWNHPTEGRIGPSRFVPIAVQAGMSHRLNQWVMREAARQTSAWRRAGYRDLFVNFNLSAEAFLRPNLEEELGELMAEFELPGNSLLVELTESTIIQDLRAAARTLQRLSELGVRAWLDDFGTGYSSLSYLRALPLKGVKIDRSFVERTVLDARDFGFLKSLIDLISYLGMQSIAEGIETREQYELLSLTTCDLYQGYHFARSMPAAQAERWMSEVGGVLRQGKIA